MFGGCGTGLGMWHMFGGTCACLEVSSWYLGSNETGKCRLPRVRECTCHHCCHRTITVCSLRVPSQYDYYFNNCVLSVFLMVFKLTMHCHHTTHYTFQVSSVVAGDGKWVRLTLEDGTPAIAAKATGSGQ